MRGRGGVPGARTRAQGAVGGGTPGRLAPCPRRPLPDGAASRGGRADRAPSGARRHRYPRRGGGPRRAPVPRGSTAARPADRQRRVAAAGGGVGWRPWPARRRSGEVAAARGGGQVRQARRAGPRRGRGLGHGRLSAPARRGLPRRRPRPAAPPDPAAGGAYLAAAAAAALSRAAAGAGFGCARGGVVGASRAGWRKGRGRDSRAAEPLPRPTPPAPAGQPPGSLRAEPSPGRVGRGSADSAAGPSAASGPRAEQPRVHGPGPVQRTQGSAEGRKREGPPSPTPKCPRRSRRPSS